ncbi:MAG: hypothetical protein V9E82_15775 [Candidatus Nanopelagicales bacterium]
MIRVLYLAAAASVILVGCGAPGNGASVGVENQPITTALPIPELVEGKTITLNAQAG